MRPLTISCFLAAALVVQCASACGAITYDVVADTNTSVPETDLKFEWFQMWYPGPPALEGGSVAFMGGASDVAGVYAHIGGELKRIADTRMSPPGNSFSYKWFLTPGISHDKVLFQGGTENPYNHAAIYVWAHGETSIVVDTSTAVPGEGSTFLEFIAPKIQGDTVAFIGRWEEAGKSHYGVFKAAGEGLQTLVKTGDAVPGSTATFTWIQGMGMDQDNVAFWAFDTQGVSGIYTVIDGRIARVVDTSMTLPGYSGPYTISWYPSIEGGNVAFEAELAGIYARLNGSVVRIADYQTAQPGTGMPFHNFDFYVPVSEGQVVFSAKSSASGTDGIYYSDGTKLERVIDFTSALAGSSPAELRIGDTGLDSGQIVFWAKLNSGVTGVYVASGVGNIGESRFSPTQYVRTSGAGGYQLVLFNYYTSELQVTPYQEDQGSIAVPFLSRRWNGTFFYDYTSAAFTQATYQYSEKFVTY